MSRRARMKRAARVAAMSPTQPRPATPVAAPPVVADPEPVVEVEVAVEDVLEEVQADGEVTEAEEDQLRQLAKSKGISHWWSKSVERLQLELAELEG